MKLFTLAEAEALLPQVRQELLAMQAAKRELDVLRVELAGAIEKSGGNGHMRDEAALQQKRQRAETLVAQLNEGLERFTGWGVEVKGVDEGLADFPSERDGRVVYLCWRLGEDHIAWWHDIEAGFAGRQPL